MKARKLFSFLCAIVMLMLCGSSFTVFAEKSEAPEYDDNIGKSITSTGLIMDYSLGISGSSKTIYITARTTATDLMAKVGFDHISIQRSSNGSSGWTEETSLPDDYALNAVFHIKPYESHSVTGGYYYRVALNHHAKETGWFFPRSENIINCSNVIWIPAS